MNRLVLKRAMDLLGSVAGLIVLSPLMGLTALAILVAMGRPVLFHQVRPGLDGKPFRLHKFRTMADSIGEDGIPLPDEMRLTPLGRFLRAASIDELPELWNVLTGEMSLVGPRPLRMEYLPLYTAEQWRRHTVKPGITGWAQVNGRNELSWERKFELDLWYIDNWSLYLDMKILFLTVVHLMRPRGITAKGHATMPRFKGTSATR